MSLQNTAAQKQTTAMLNVLLTSLTVKSDGGKPLLPTIGIEKLVGDLLAHLDKQEVIPQASVNTGLTACAKMVVSISRTETLAQLWMRLALKMFSKDLDLKSGKLRDPQTQQQMLIVLMSGCLSEVDLGASNSTSTDNLVLGIKLLITCLRSLGELGVTKYSPAPFSTVLQGLLGKHSKKESVIQACCEALYQYWDYLTSEFSVELKVLFSMLKRQRLLKAREDFMKVPQLNLSGSRSAQVIQTNRTPLQQSLEMMLEKTFQFCYLLTAPLVPGREGPQLLAQLTAKKIAHYAKLFTNMRSLFARFDPEHPLVASLLPELSFLACSLAELPDLLGLSVDGPAIISFVRPTLESLANSPVSSSELRKNLSLCRTAAGMLSTESRKELLSWSLVCKIFKPVLPQTVQLGSVQVFGTGGVSELLSSADLERITSMDLTDLETSELIQRKLTQTPLVLLRDFLPQFLFDTQQISSGIDNILTIFSADFSSEIFQKGTAHIEDFISFVLSVHRSDSQVSVAELSTKPSQIDEPLLELCAVLFVLQALVQSTDGIEEVFLVAAETCVKDLVCWAARSYLEASNLVFSSRGKTLYSLVTNLGLVALTHIVCRRADLYPTSCQHTWANSMVYNLLSIEEIDGSTAANLAICLCSIVSSFRKIELTSSSSLKAFLAANQSELIETAKFQLLNSPGSRAASSSICLLAYLAKFALSDPDPRLPRALLPLVATVVDTLPVKPAPGLNFSLLTLFDRLLDIIKTCKTPEFLAEEEDRITNHSPSRMPVANLFRRIALRVIPWLNRQASADRQSLVIEAIGKLSETLKDLPQMIESADEPLSAHEPAHCVIPSAAEPLIVEIWPVLIAHLLGIVRGIVQSDDPRSKALLDLINASSQTRINWCKGKLSIAFDEQEEGEDKLFKAALLTREKLVGKLQGPKVDRVLILPTLELLRDIGRLHPTIMRFENRAELLSPFLCVAVLYFKPSDPIWVPHVKEVICVAEMIQKMFSNSLRDQLRPLIDLLAYRAKSIKSQSPYLDRLNQLVASDTKI